MKIKHPEWLQIKTEKLILYGYDQDWYATSFRRTRGCGPTAAAMQLLYLNKREEGPLPYGDNNISSIATALEIIWDFITPGWLLGLNSTQKFCAGMEELFSHYQLKWLCHRLSVPTIKSKRPSLSQTVAFIEAGIVSDCPIAFLNLHKGEAVELESWHWIVLVALAYDEGEKRYVATCYDGGRSLTFDLGLWLSTTKFGGGFVYLTV